MPDNASLLGDNGSVQNIKKDISVTMPSHAAMQFFVLYIYNTYNDF